MILIDLVYMMTRWRSLVDTGCKTGLSLRRAAYSKAAVISLGSSTG
jgi:hypothetical protein